MRIENTQTSENLPKINLNPKYPQEHFKCDTILKIFSLVRVLHHICSISFPSTLLKTLASYLEGGGKDWGGIPTFPNLPAFVSVS